MRALLLGLDAVSVKVCDFPLFTINSKKPAFFMGTAAVQAYQIAIAGLYTTTAQGVVEGNIPAYYGMEVIHFPSLAAGEFIISAPENIVMLTDDYNDVRAIDMKWEAELSSDKIWGQFKLGFSYLKGEEIARRLPNQMSKG